MGRLSVVKLGIKDHTVADSAPDCFYPSNQLVNMLVFLDRHKIGKLPDSFQIEKAGEGHVGVGKIHLSVPSPFVKRSNRELATVVFIEDSRKYGGRIEVRKEHEIDRPDHSQRATMCRSPTIP
jgi:hypothetical protein